MNRDALLLQALRGPLMLIVLGTLFAMDHAGSVSFGKSWPVLIILYGVLRLAERSLGGPGPMAPPPVNPPFPTSYPNPNFPGGQQ